LVHRAGHVRQQPHPLLVPHVSTAHLTPATGRFSFLTLRNSSGEHEVEYGHGEAGKKRKKADANGPPPASPVSFVLRMFAHSKMPQALAAYSTPSKIAWQTYSCSSQVGASVKTRVKVYGLVNALRIWKFHSFFNPEVTPEVRVLRRSAGAAEIAIECSGRRTRCVGGAGLPRQRIQVTYLVRSKNSNSLRG